MSAINRNYGSAKTLSLTTIYRGAEALTLSGADAVAIESLFSGQGRQTVPVPIVIPNGQSVGITVTPPTGNTSMVVQIAMAVYKLTQF
jgi:hypothetical protein